MSISTGDELFYESGPIMARGSETKTVTIDKVVSRRYFTIIFDQQIVDRGNKTEMGSILKFDSDSYSELQGKGVSIVVPQQTSQTYNTLIPVFYGPSTQTFTPSSGLNIQNETYQDNWSFYYISNGSDYSPRRYKLVFDKVDQNFRLYINNVLYGTGNVTLVDSLSQTKIYSMFVKCNDSFSDSPYTEVRGIAIAEFSNLQDAIDYDGSSIPANTYVTVDPSTSTNWRKTIYRDYRTTWGRVSQSLYVPCDCSKVTSQYFSIDADVMLGYGWTPGQQSSSFSSIWFRRGIDGVVEDDLFSMDTSSSFNMGEAMRYVGYIAAPATAGTATMNSDHVSSFRPYSNTQYMRWGIDSGPATYRYGTYLWKALPDGYNITTQHLDQTRLQWHRLRIVFTSNTNGTIFLDGTRLGDFTTDVSVKSIVDIRIWDYYSGIANLCIREYSSSTYALADNGRDRMLMYPTSTSARYISGIAESAADEVTIGSQTWMSKNLAIDDGQGGIYTQTVNYGHGNVTEYYYTWPAAVRAAATVRGWHLPTAAEWDTLVNTVGSDTAGTKLKSTYGWTAGNGTDDFGFSAFPAGNRYLGSFYNLGRYAHFWTATEYSSTSAYICQFRSIATVYSDFWNKTNYGFSVRLIKD